MRTERQAGGKRFECARLHARDFSPMDALTVASMLPGVGGHYRETRPAVQCLNAQLNS